MIRDLFSHSRALPIGAALVSAVLVIFVGHYFLTFSTPKAAPVSITLSSSFVQSPTKEISSGSIIGESGSLENAPLALPDAASPDEVSSDEVKSAPSSLENDSFIAAENPSVVLTNPKSLPVVMPGPVVKETQQPLVPTAVGALYQRSLSSGSFVSVGSLPTNPEVTNIIHTVFPQEEWSRAERIAGCESGMKNVSSKPNSNGSVDHGIFQLNDAGTLQGLLRQLGQDPNNTALALDASWNVKAAHVLWTQRGWQPWSCAAKLQIVDGLWSSTPGPNW